MKKIGTVILFCLMAALSWGGEKSYRTPFSASLEREISAKKIFSASPGMGRLWLMRFYPPRISVKKTISRWEKLFHSDDVDMQARATAFYLFNMYVSTASYGEDMPARLTTDYLGVLDGFYKTRWMYPLQHAETFYQKNKNKIKDKLAEFFSASKNVQTVYDKNNSANDERELAFMRLLAQTPMYRGRPSYFMARSNRLKGEAAAADCRLVEEQIRRSLAQTKNKVVTFEFPMARAEDLDRKIGIKSANMNRTYRSVNDECEYCSYEFGKRVCLQFNTPGENRGAVRLYKITAVPVKGGGLVPADGTRFKLANGQTAPNWKYHTATLLIMRRNGRFAPVVADKFLGGERPVSWDKWSALFSSSDTFFYIAPFVRTQEMEEAVKTPQKRKGNDVIIDGKVYSPDPVEE